MSGQYKNQVRIIGGTLKRRLLRFPLIDGLRPTPDRVRETLFNWLGQDCTGLTCLDLFAGSGALSFEAASRNAARVVAVETAKPALEALRANQANLKAGNLEIIWSDALRFLDTTSEKFDLVFLDPPFRRELLPQVCELLEQRGWLAPDALIYLEREKEMADLPLPASWQLLKDKQAGQVCYQLYLREVNDEAGV